MKSAWEARFGILIDPRFHAEFRYTFKPYDSGMYGGQPRIDWHACDMVGRYWMAEIKMLGKGRKSLNLLSEITPGQRDGLDAVSRSDVGIALLAVADGTILHIFDWRKIQWLYEISGKPFLTMDQAATHLIWKGPKGWRLFNLYEELASQGVLTRHPLIDPLMDPGILPVPTISVPESPVSPPPPSPSISKPEGSIRTKRRKLLSGPLLSKPGE